MRLVAESPRSGVVCDVSRESRVETGQRILVTKVDDLVDPRGTGPARKTRMREPAGGEDFRACKERGDAEEGVVRPRRPLQVEADRRARGRPFLDQLELDTAGGGLALILDKSLRIV